MTVLLMIIIALLGMIVFNVVNIYFLSKFDINKWLVLAVTICIFTVGLILEITLTSFRNNTVFNLIFIFLLVFFIFWFLAVKDFKPKEKKEIIIRSKPKPRRANKN